MRRFRKTIQAAGLSVDHLLWDLACSRALLADAGVDPVVRAAAEHLRGLIALARRGSAEAAAELRVHASAAHRIGCVVDDADTARYAAAILDADRARHAQELAAQEGVA